MKVAFCYLTLALLGLFLNEEVGADSKQRMPTYIRSEHALVIEGWQREFKMYRLADDADCKCEEDIAGTRRGYGGDWKAIPNYHPYYMVGDFNGDGKEDFAIAILASRQSKEFSVAIFNGPFTGLPNSKAAYFGGKFPLGYALFFGPPRPIPYRLIVGPFEAEGIIMEPRGSSYVESGWRR